jgi:hypothetical protein
MLGHSLLSWLSKSTSQWVLELAMEPRQLGRERREMLVELRFVKFQGADRVVSPRNIGSKGSLYSHCSSPIPHVRSYCSLKF